MKPEFEIDSASPDFTERFSSLCLASAWPHAVDKLSVIETHISWVILTGKWAYKIKKPVNPGFLDFSTLQKRHHFCQEELRINRRYTDGIYDRVMSISEVDGQLRVGDEANVIEYAVRMHQFPADSEVVDATGNLTVGTDQFAKFGARLAENHEASRIDEAHHGNPGHQVKLVQDTLDALDVLLGDDPFLENQLGFIKLWFQEVINKVKPVLQDRYVRGCVRECHGDLHLGNVVNLDGSLTSFDALEFDPGLRWTDVCADVAFLMMDLEEHGASDASHAFLIGWLDRSGDYDALRVMRFFKFYRALVRARVNAISLKKNELENALLRDKVVGYLALARRYAQPMAIPRLYVMRGLSGSGKSWIAERLVGPEDTLLIRSDIQRQRVTSTPDGTALNDYSKLSREQVYTDMRMQAESALEGGFSVILDATHLAENQCDAARELATEHGAPFLILNPTASHETLAGRIRKRGQEGIDESEATVEVLHKQLKTYQELSDINQPFVYSLNSESKLDVEKIASIIPYLASIPRSDE